MPCCNEKDLVSVFVDGELPEKFASDFKNHLENCPECKKTFDSYCKIQKILALNSNSFQTDSTYLEQSFSRLRTKMAYAKVSKASKGGFLFEKFEKNANFAKKVFSHPVLSGAIVAAIFGFVFVPLGGIFSKKEVSELKTIARADFTPVSEQGVIADENLVGTQISAVFNESDSIVAKNDYDVQNFQSEFDDIQNQKIISAAVASFGETISGISSIDVFKPQFEDHAEEFSFALETPFGVFTIFSDFASTPNIRKHLPKKHPNFFASREYLSRSNQNQDEKP